MSHEAAAGAATRRRRLLSALPWMWLAMSAAWAVVLFISDLPAWPLALWIATTLAPLIALKTHLDRTPIDHRRNP